MIVLKALALVAFLVVPGWLAVSLLSGGNETLDGKERLFLAACLGVGIVVASALALSLASAYSTTALLILVGSICALLAVMVRKRLSWPAKPGWKEALFSLAIIAVALALFSPPGRTVFGWSDVGVYTDIAAHIEREGGESFVDPLVVKVAPERRDLLYEPNNDANLRFDAFENKAFFITAIDEGRVVPQFYYLWPSLLAVFASFLGLENMFWAVTAMGVLALWGLLLLARRLLGWRWGLAAAVLAAVSPLLIYFAKYTTSEMMNMALFVAASLCLVAYLGCDAEGGKQDAVRLAVGAAFLMTLGLLSRIDFMLAVVPIVLCYLGKRVLGRLSRADWWFFGLVLAGAALSLLVGAVFSPPYFHTVMGSNYRNVDWLLGAPGIIILAVCAALFIFADAIRQKFGPMFKGDRKWARAISVALLWSALVALFVYMYFVRPHGADDLVRYGGINAITGPAYEKQALVRWAWYFSFVGVLLIYAGYALWFTFRRAFANVLLATIGIVFTLMYSWNLRNTPLHILTMRRIIPVAVPMACIVTAFFLRSLAQGAGRLTQRWRWTRWVGAVAVAVLFLYIFVYSVNASVPIMGLAEGGNQLELCAEIAGSVEENAVVLMDYHLGDLFGAPLRCFNGVENAWLMNNSTLGEEEFEFLLADLGYPETPVYLLWRPGMSGTPMEMSGGNSLKQVGTLTWSEEVLESSFTHRPSRRMHNLENVEFFRIEQ